MLDTKCITQVVCRIQFSNSFKLFDKWGEIVDGILYSSSAKNIFGEQYYNSVSEDVGYQRGLLNNITKNNLRLTQNNLILSHSINDNDFDKQYSFFIELFTKYIFPQIITKHILVVQRIGIVFTCSINEAEIAKYKKTILQPSYCECISDFRFSKKETTPIALIRQDTNNYINKIVTVGNLTEGVCGVSYDYQYYYLPSNAQAGKDIDKLFNNAFENLNSDIFLKIEGTK